MRQAIINRETNETNIALNLNIDGCGSFEGTSGIGFFDHMLNTLAVHSGFDITLSTQGDLSVDGHHTVEDIGIVLGRAFAKVLGDKKGIRRFGESYIPMDEVLALTDIDISGRPFLVINAEFRNERIGEYDACLTKEFFRAFAFNAGITLHTEILYGENSHHMTEALFKSLAHSLKKAVVKTEEEMSAKGLLI